MHLPESVTKRVGPLPVWGWGAVVVGSVGLFLIIRGRRKASSAASSSGASGSGGALGLGGSGGSFSGYSTAAIPPTLSIPLSGVTAPALALPTRLLSAIAPSPTAPEPPRDFNYALPDTIGRVLPNSAESAARALKSTVDLATRNVGGDPSTVVIMGSTGSQSTNNAVASNLVSQGYGALVSGGQIYVSPNRGTPENTWATLLTNSPAEAQARFRKWVTA